MLIRLLCQRDPQDRAGRLAFAWLVLLVVLMPLPATAQDEAQLRRGKLTFANKATCPYCHGWAGDGQGEPRSERGPSLRATELTPGQIREVVQCGRPGTNMPYHDKFAYTDDRCYGLTKEDLGNDDMPNLAFNTLQAREIDAVIAYLVAKVLGRAEITLEECIDFWGEGAKVCDAYRN